MLRAEIRQVLTSRGRWHRVVILDGRRLTDERCNLDDAAGIVSEVDDDAPPPESSRCRHCYRRDDDD